MIYDNISEAIFLRRLNRFMAEVEVNGEVEQVHVKNTSRCRELLLEGSKVYLEAGSNPNRKTKYSVISVYKGADLYNIDSQVPNKVVFDSLLAGKIKELPLVTYAKREVSYGSSRFDIYYETETTKGFIEVKGVTLEKGGIAMFPDAPTVRGTKHVLELAEGLREGYDNYIFLLLQMNTCDTFRPHHEQDIKFAEALYRGMKQGLKVLVYNSQVTSNSIELFNPCKLLEKSF